MANNPTALPCSSPISKVDNQDVLEDIFENIKSRLHGPISRFIEKYFGSFQYTHQGDVLEIQTPGGTSSQSAVPSVIPSPDDFQQWFSDYLQEEREGARGSWHVLPGTGAGEGTRLLLTLPTRVTSTPNGHTIWDHVQVVGQFYPYGPVSYKDGLVQLSRWADKVFASQPLRLFLHGLYIRGSLIEYWIFDRSGLYCSEVLNIHKDFIRFLSIIPSYQLMTDQDHLHGYFASRQGPSHLSVCDGITLSIS